MTAGVAEGAMERRRVARDNGPDGDTRLRYGAPAAATARAATHIYETWWESGTGIDEPGALELWRLCTEAGHTADAVAIAAAVTAAWQRQGRYAEADALREQVAADSERVLGPDHPDTLTARGALARWREEFDSET